MKLVETVTGLHSALDACGQGKKVGLVPTMGALHAGHASLVRRCVADNDVTVVSVFVNPTQFNDKNDLKNYPRTLDADCKLLEEVGADIVFATRFPDQYGLKDLKNYIEFGGSPRASINLALAARAYAFIKRRGYVIPEDVRAVAHDVLRHRIGLSYEAEANNVTSEEIISQILNKVEVP